MNNPTQIVIIGGGFSIKPHLKELQEKLQEKFTIGLNYSFNYFDSTILCYVDRTFYDQQRQELAKLPLIIGKTHKFPEGKLPNTIFLQGGSKYNRDVRKGCYKSSLVGIYALSLGIWVLEEGEIFLLGFDYGEARTKEYDENNPSLDELTKNRIKDKDGKPLTHFYQGEIKHRGIGKINYYNAKGRAGRDFAPFAQEKKVKIYNVSLDSRIPTFLKIFYNQFFNLLDKNTYDQNELREDIKKKLQ